MNNNAENNTWRQFFSKYKFWIFTGIFLLILLIAIIAITSVMREKRKIPATPTRLHSTSTKTLYVPTLLEATETIEPSATVIVATDTPVSNHTFTSSVTTHQDGNHYYPSSTQQASSSPQPTNTPEPFTATPDFALLTQQALYAAQTAQSLMVTQTIAAQQTNAVNYTAPSVSSIAPANGASSVEPNSNIMISFNKNVNVSGDWFVLNCGSSGTRRPGNGNVSVSGGPLSFTIVPNTQFIPGETCSLTVYAAQISDTDSYDPPDGMTADFTSSFSIEKAPAISNTYPSNGATFPNRDTITITFDEAVNTSSASFGLQCNGITRGFILSGSGTTTITLAPSSTLPNSQSCTVSVSAAGVFDADNIDPPDTMTNDYSFSFTTLSIPSEISTETEIGNVFYDVTGTGSSNVDIDSNIRITFSEAVNLTNTTNILRCNSTYIAVTVSGNLTNTIILDPQTNLTPNAYCYLEIPAAAIVDIDGTPGMNPTSRIYHSFAIVEDDAPTVSLAPGKEAETIPVDPTFTVTFNEPVTLTGGWFSFSCGESGDFRSTGELTGTGITITEITSDLVYSVKPSTILLNGDYCFLQIVSRFVADNDVIDPPNFLDGDGDGDIYDDTDNYFWVYLIED